MEYGRVNVLAGVLGLFLGALGGLALGATFDAQSIKDGYHLLPIARFFLREGHSHTMPFALLNLIVGLLLDRLALAPGWKRACSWLAVAAFALPIGLALRGALGAPPDFPPVPLIGVIGFVGAVAILGIGALRTR